MHIDFNRCSKRNRFNFFCHVKMVYVLVKLDEKSTSVAFQAHLIFRI